MTTTSFEGLQVMLFVSAQRGDDEEVERLLSFRADLVDCINSDGYTALHVAAYHNRGVVCALLLRRGAVVNAGQLGTGRSSLMLAAHRGHISMCEMLLNSG